MIFKPEENLAVSRTYSLTMTHIGKVADLAQRLEVSQGEIVRRAIDLLWEQELRREAQQAEG